MKQVRVITPVSQHPHYKPQQSVEYWREDDLEESFLRGKEAYTGLDIKFVSCVLELTHITMRNLALPQSVEPRKTHILGRVL